MIVFHRTTLALLAVIAICLVAMPLISLTALPNAPGMQRLKKSGSENAETSTITTIVPESVDELILVPCHSIFLDDGNADPKHESNWLLQAHQKQYGQLAAFIQHIQQGYRLLTERPGKRLLIFSGGQTSKLAGPQSEAQGYYRALLRLLEFDKQGDSEGKLVRYHQVATEDFARDSFENLLFSICRFYEMTGGRRYPSRIIVVGLELKRKRFTELHRAAIRFPLQQFEYVGIDGVQPVLHNGPSPSDGEMENAFRPFSRDPYGCFEPTLVDKRQQRNPYHQMSGIRGYAETCPAMAELILYCSKSIYNGQLPW